MKTKTICFCNQKGGVGKTTSCFEIATIFAARGNKVLLLDTDAQSNLTEGTGYYDSELSEGNSYTIYETLMGMVAFEDAIVTVRDNIDIIPGSRKMLAQAFPMTEDIYRLKEAIPYILEYKEYDYIMVDVGPSAGQIMTMALLASDYVIAVGNLARFSYSGVVQMCADLENGYKFYNRFDVKPLGILINSAKKTNVQTVNKDKYDELAENFGATPFETMISNSTIVDEAKEFGISTYEYKPSSKISREYGRVVDEIIERIKNS